MKQSRQGRVQIAPRVLGCLFKELLDFNLRFSPSRERGEHCIHTRGSTEASVGVGEGEEEEECIYVHVNMHTVPPYFAKF